ncbi:unnamed protein product [Soboliphyme baturini]|uniref:protein-tyrosine-phosphatase n=1 Tax=Soboliphyme baturini TaxID=241478 RepID=A0A183IVR8_9BILA|nr:unnamed protein product [Soboliphyme baturini]
MQGPLRLKIQDTNRKVRVLSPEGAIRDRAREADAFGWERPELQSVNDSEHEQEEPSTTFSKSSLTCPCARKILGSFADTMTSKAVLFVCLGNICRSPMAEAVFKDLLKKRNILEKVRLRYISNILSFHYLIIDSILTVFISMAS